MTITTKREAMKKLTDSLFNPVNGGTLNIMKYDNGKYNWTGRQSDYVGKDVDDLNGSVCAVWVARKADSDGTYAQVMCLTSR